MVLVPKILKVISIDRFIDQFHLIVLSKFLFRILLKILVDRLATIASKIVSHNQFGFLYGRYIEDCIAIASYCFNALDKRCYGGNITMKIEIRKTSDFIS